MTHIGKNNRSCSGLTIVELVLVLMIISFLLSFASLPAIQLVTNSKLESDVDRLDSFLQQCVHHAVLKNKTVEVVFYLDIGEYEAYELYENKEDVFSSGTSGSKEDDLKDIASQFARDDSNERELIFTGTPMKFFVIDGIQFEDMSTTSGGELYFYADGGGWQESFIVSLTTEDGEKSRWLRCDRATASVRTFKTSAKLPEPRKSLR